MTDGKRYYAVVAGGTTVDFLETEADVIRVLRTEADWDASCVTTTVVPEWQCVENEEALIAKARREWDEEQARNTRVERAARALHAQDCSTVPWDDLPEYTRKALRGQAIGVLHAADYDPAPDTGETDA